MTIESSMIITAILASAVFAGIFLVMWIVDRHPHDLTYPLYGMSYCKICGKTVTTEYRSDNDPPSNP